MSRRHRGGRATPKAHRPPHLRVVDRTEPDGSPADALIDSGGRELLAGDDPITAEMWASALLDAFERARHEALLERLDAPAFEESLLHRCRQRHDPFSGAVAGALAGVVPPPHDRLAARVVSEIRELAPGLPGWIGSVGSVTPTRAWVVTDVFGDQTSLLIGFRQEGEPREHVLAALVDHNLSGQAKDAWIGGDLAEVVASWKANADSHMQIGEVPTEEALGRLRDAMAMSDLWNGDADLRTDDFARTRALVWARLRRAGLNDDRPGEIGVGHAEREALVREFMASQPGSELSGRFAGEDVEVLARHLVDLRSDYEGRPLRWSPTVVSLILSELAPRTLLLDTDLAAVLPAVVKGFVRFSAGRTGIPEPFVEETIAAVDEEEPEYLHRIGNPAHAGPAKAMLAALQARGVDLSDLDAVNDALERYGAMRLPAAATKRRRDPRTAPTDVVASAECAPVIARFDVLTTFFGGGRKLTQTGQPTLADARELVGRLGTQDRVDPAFGGRTYKTMSAAQLPELGFTLRWAVAAGALRKEHGKLRATAAWGKLGAKPLDRWMKAADAVVSLGPLAAFQVNNRYRSSEEILDELAAEILHLLNSRPISFEEVLDWVCERADTEYEWLAPYMQNPEYRRTSLGWDLDLLVRILGWAGIADRIGAQEEPSPYGSSRLVGGTLQLTTAGRWWLGSD